MGRGKAGELELKGRTGSLKLARDQGGGKACEGAQTEGQNTCKGEKTLCYHRKMELIAEEQMWSWEGNRE